MNINLTNELTAPVGAETLNHELGGLTPYLKGLVNYVLNNIAETPIARCRCVIKNASFRLYYCIGQRMEGQDVWYFFTHNRF